MDAQGRNRANVAAQLREEALLLAATMGGEFDAEIKRLTALNKEISTKLKAAGAVDQADEILKRAKDYEAGVMAKAAEYDEKFKQLSENVAKQERIVNSAMDDMKKREQVLADGLHELASKVAQFDARAGATEQAMSERAKKLEAGEGALIVARAEAEGLKRDLNARLDKLRAA